MGEKIRPKFEAGKVEKEEKLNEKIESHLEYVEKIEASALKYIEKDIKIKQDKFGPADMTNELAEARRLEGIIDEFNEKARKQAERGEDGKELSFNLSLPWQVEVRGKDPKTVKTLKALVEAEAQLKVLRAWSKSNELDRAMKQFIENQISLFRGRIKFLSREVKKREI